MSEILTKPSTTKESQNNTHSDIISIPDFNFSINVDVKIHLDPEVRALLTKVAGFATLCKPVFNVLAEGLNKPACASNVLLEDDPTEPAQNPVEEPIEPEKEPEKYGQIVYGEENSWNWIQQYKNLRWKTKGRNLLIKYWSGNVTTTWENIERLARLPEKQRNEEVNTLSNSCNYKTGMRMFIKCLNDGLITKPDNPDAEIEGNFAKYVEEENNAVLMEE